MFQILEIFCVVVICHEELVFEEGTLSPKKQNICSRAMLAWSLRLGQDNHTKACLPHVDAVKSQVSIGWNTCFNFVKIRNDLKIHCMFHFLVVASREGSNECLL